jgi:release factor glutamine methyltransferase
MEVSATGNGGLLIRKGLKYLLTKLGQPLIRKYLLHTRVYGYEGIRLEIPAGVFHPGLFFSTRLMIRHLKKEEMHGKSFLELGAGSGLIALLAAKRGAVSTATDINQLALHHLRKNSFNNRIPVQIVYSDVFTLLEPQSFDIICINPPYFMKDPETMAQHAWYCGKNGEFFEKFFSQVRHFCHAGTKIYMVLSDACNVKLIRSIAAKHNYQLLVVHKKTNWIEVNYIFSVEPAMKFINKPTGHE